jgi:flagellar biosynthesis protein FlhF
MPGRSVRPAAPSPISGLEAQIAELRSFIVRLGGARLLAPELTPLYERLLAAGLDESIAFGIVSNLPRGGADGRLLDAERLEAELEHRLLGLVRIAAPAWPPRGVIALVGPPGAGKTTTLAKLAARTRLAGMPVELVSLDDGGLGAPSPLESFARILSVPYTFALSRADLEAVLRRAPEQGAVFVDTSGISPGAEDAVTALQAVLGSLPRAETHVVLPATSKAADASAAVRVLAPLRATHTVWTRLDETATPGTLLTVSVDDAPPLSYFATGREIPGDIKPATAHELIQRILHGGVEP